MPHVKPAIPRTASEAVRLKARGLLSRPIGCWRVICDQSGPCGVSSGLLVVATAMAWTERRA